MIGFWGSPALAVVVGAAVIMSYQWPMSLVYGAVGGTPPAATEPRGERQRASFDAAWDAVAPRAQGYASTEPARRFRSRVRPVHTGEALGLIGQTIAALVSAGAALLVWSGFALALRRWGAWMGRRARTARA